MSVRAIIYDDMPLEDNGPKVLEVDVPDTLLIPNEPVITAVAVDAYFRHRTGPLDGERHLCGVYWVGIHEATGTIGFLSGFRHFASGVCVGPQAHRFLNSLRDRAQRCDPEEALQTDVWKTIFTTKKVG